MSPWLAYYRASYSPKQFTTSTVRVCCHGVCVLPAFSVFINSIGRGNLSIAAPLIKDELELSASQLGILPSSFFWAYGLFQILSGWLVGRFNVNWVMAIGFFFGPPLGALPGSCMDSWPC